MKEKTQVNDIDRSFYDFRNEDADAFKVDAGLTKDIVLEISKEKNDPDWMRELRLKCLDIYNSMEVPDWGPSLDALDIDNIFTYVRPNMRGMQNDWENVPKDIKDTFDRLGIPQAERKSLAGVGAQYDSEIVYHSIRDEAASKGVIYTDIESALANDTIR